MCTTILFNFCTLEHSYYHTWCVPNLLFFPLSRIEDAYSYHPFLQTYPIAIWAFYTGTTRYSRQIDGAVPTRSVRVFRLLRAFWEKSQYTDVWTFLLRGVNYSSGLVLCLYIWSVSIFFSSRDNIDMGLVQKHSCDICFCLCVYTIVAVRHDDMGACGRAPYWSVPFLFVPGFASMIFLLISYGVSFSGCLCYSHRNDPGHHQSTSWAQVSDFGLSPCVLLL